MNIEDKQYTNDKRKSSRFPTSPTSERINCLFCNTFVDFISSPSDGIQVKTTEFSQTIKEISEKRKDEWGYLVLGRINYKMSDLHAADCIYHRSCCVNFRTGKQMPTKYAPEGGNPKKRKAGRATNDEQIIAFQKTCKYFEENDEEQLKLSELVEIMQSYLRDSEMSAYGRKHMQRKLVDHYGDEIIIASGDGKSTLITLRKSVDSILRKFYDEPKTDIQ